MLNFSASDANGKTTLQRLPDIVPVNEAQVVHAFLLENGLTPSPELATRTVREVVTLLTHKFLCVNTWELCGDGQVDLHGANAEALASAATGTGSGEIYMFEQCTSHVATATQATLERRPDATEGSTAIPEGTPPSPSLAAVDEDVDAWLVGAGLGKYVDAIKEYGYDTMTALRVASKVDIVEMCEDADVNMKKPHRKVMLVKWQELVA